MLAKNPSGSKRMIRACRLPRNQRNANAAPVKSALAASGCSLPSASASSAERDVDVAEQRRVGAHQLRRVIAPRRYNIGR